MDIINQIFNTTLSSFDFSYCIDVNILTYIIIKLFETKDITLPTWKKRIILLGVIICISAAYFITGTDNKLILNSAILSPVFWTWIMKPFVKQFNADYKSNSKDNLI